MSRLAVTVLMGGPDAEREVSVASGIAVTTALEQSGKFDVTPQRIDCPTEREIAESFGAFMKNHNMLIEGSAAMAIAGFLKQKDRWSGKQVAIVLCGANISTKTLKELL